MANKAAFSSRKLLECTGCGVANFTGLQDLLPPYKVEANLEHRRI